MDVIKNVGMDRVEQSAAVTPVTSSMRMAKLAMILMNVDGVYPNVSKTATIAPVVIPVHVGLDTP